MTDYFAFYGLPVGFNPDVSVVKQKFYELSKKYHPDFYINESQEKQDEVLELSTLNNKAYQLLRDPQQRLQYVLELKGLLQEGEGYKLPQDFLMEMMEINEALMDLQFDPDAERLADLKKEVNGVEAALTLEIAGLTASFDTIGAEEQAQTLLRIKDLFYRNKYVFRLRESIIKASSGTSL